MAANGVVAHQWMPVSMKLDGFEGYDAAREDVHVLAVDDSHVDRKVIERLLKISSFKVTVVDSGTRALQFLGLDGSVDTSSVGYNEGLKVDLIITDYCMPGMTGYELLKKIKESSSFREVPVVIMSSENVMARINRCLEEGAEEFIMKPVKLSDVKRLRNYTTAIRKVRADTDPETGTVGTGGNSNPTTNKRKLMEPTYVSSDLSSSPPSILSSPSSDPSSPSISSSATSSPTSSLDSPTRRPKLTHPV